MQDDSEAGTGTVWRCPVCEKDLPTEMGFKVHMGRLHQGIHRADAAAYKRSAGESQVTPPPAPPEGVEAGAETVQFEGRAYTEITNAAGETVGDIVRRMNAEKEQAALNESAEVEVCEGGCSDPVTHHDREGVPLCEKCYQDAVQEGRETLISAVDILEGAPGEGVEDAIQTLERLAGVTVSITAVNNFDPSLEPRTAEQHACDLAEKLEEARIELVVYALRDIFECTEADAEAFVDKYVATAIEAGELAGAARARMEATS